MHDERRGLIYGASSYLLWGLFPLYWPLLEPAGTLEILAQRMVWSLVFVLIVLCASPVATAASRRCCAIGGNGCCSQAPRS